MKSREAIEKKIVELNNAPKNYVTDTQISYLVWSLDADFPAWWAEHLVRKYDWEIKEDKAIVEILRWILDLEDEEI